MKKIYLTETKLEVSALSIGTAQFGTGVSKKTAFHQLDVYTAFEGNLIDTAHVYGNWIPGMDSPSEETVGEWLKSTGKRNSVILSTKGGHPEMKDMTAMRVIPSELESDLEASLKKLQTDYIDLYFLHRDDSTIPVEVMLEWLEKKVKEGKIRYYGCSNWEMPRIREALEAAEKNGWYGFVCNQAMGCLADVHPETLPPSNVVLDSKLRAYHEESQLGFMAYMSVARGYFSKVLSGKPLNQESIDNYTTPSNDRIVEKLKELCDEQYNVMDFCYQYIIQQKFPSVAIASFSSDRQLEEAVKAVDCNMPAGLLKQVVDLKELQ